MQKIFKWLTYAIGGLIGLIVLIAGGLYANASARINKVYAIQAESLTIPADREAIARGKQWVSSECAHCHGSDLAGTILLDDPQLGKIAAPNLTSGMGGAGNEFTDKDWILAIRHGINPEGHSLLIMPADNFYYFSDSDLGDIIAYLKSLPPVDKVWPEPELKPLAYVLIGAGAFGNILVAENIDRSSRPFIPEQSVSAVYGEYLVRISGCKACHGENLTGEKNPPNPAAPSVPGIVAGSEASFWSEAEFINTIRTGTTPSRRPLTEFMPWKDYRNMTDDQLIAIWLYLISFQPR